MDWNALIPSLFDWLKSDPFVVICAALCWLTYNRQKKVDDLQEKRVDDTRTLTDALNESTNAAEKLVNVVASLTDEIRRNGGK